MAQTTLAQYRTRVADKVGLDSTDANDQTRIDDWVNEGYEDFLLRTRCNVRKSTLATIADVEDYELDSDILSVLEFYSADSDGNQRDFDRLTPAELIELRKGSPASQAHGNFYAVQGLNLLMIYPTPSEAYNLTVYYVRRPSALSATADIPSDIPAEFHKALEFWALAEAGDYDDDATSEFGERYRGRYELMVLEARKQQLWRGGRALADAVVKGPRTRLRLDDRSRWPRR